MGGALKIVEIRSILTSNYRLSSPTFETHTTSLHCLGRKRRREDAVGDLPHDETNLT